jgi:Tfp pilus assembly protein FimT
MKMEKQGRTSGFTLIEAVFVIALLGALVYAGAGSFMSLAPKYRLESAVWQIRSALNAARYKAMFEGNSVRVRFSPAGVDTEKYDPDKKAWLLVGRNSPEGVRVEANNSPVFTGQGTVTGLGTITVANEWGSYKLTLAITGRVKTTRVT